MSDVVWAINPQKDNLRDLLRRMRRFASDVCNGRGIGFEFDAPTADTGLTLGANIRREVFAIFKEAVNNAAKYSQAKRVRAALVVDDDFLRLEIIDDGNGFDTEKILRADFAPEDGGNGLINMRRRAEEMDGECRIFSSAAGTTITVSVPVHSTPKDPRR